MSLFILRRLGAMLVTLGIIASAGFFLLEAIPGDPARQLAGPSASTEAVERIRDTYGFDDPVWVRYSKSISSLFAGDLGFSFSRREPARDVIFRSLWTTLALTSLAFIAELLVALPLALATTRRRSRFARRLLLAGAGGTAAFPPFLIGLVLIYVFAFRLQWFPIGGLDSVQSWVLPVLACAIPYGLVLARILVIRLEDEATKPYAQFALSRGERPSTIQWRHLLPNALLPLVSLLALDFAALFANIVVIEVAFSIEGLGAVLFDALRTLDTALTVAIALVAGAVVATVNLTADATMIAFDPRRRR